MLRLLYTCERAMVPVELGGWVGPRPDLDVVEKKFSLAPAGIQTLD
jgi:hypothetical protein